MHVSRVLDRQLLNGWCHCHKNRRLCSRPHSHESVIFSYFWDSYFLIYGKFKMHEMKLCVQVLRSRVARVEPCHWSEGHHNYVRVSLQERQATMQVMLGVSLRARWDATLVYNKGTNYTIAWSTLHFSPWRHVQSGTNAASLGSIHPSCNSYMMTIPPHWHRYL